ncbi:class I SAM-dependent methyltransferase [Tardiphaga sp.]|uniref:class I SAM-dependent methyltransferase n=1 Tax=Tardiphaga sp. TaxID=1926292 RepID=UPI0026188247|nr:class I SAM-dependent methyltransferase [Tardiphaga sp.]
MKFENPKTAPGTDPVDAWYRYYAGYSAAFVAKALKEVAPRARIVLDPWNGTGTTTVVAASNKIGAIGFDINPAMVVVARARLLGQGVWASIAPLSADIVVHANARNIEDDPLRFWFVDRSAANIRALQASVHRLLVDAGTTTYPIFDCVSSMSTLAAFFYTALFRTVRLLLAPAAGSNPTWWKRLDENERLNPGRKIIFDTFIHSTMELAEGLHRANFSLAVQTRVDVGDCRQLLSIADQSIDTVITSPPYCTRIDYGISTLPELAVLGAHEEVIKKLRNTMVGTPTITGEDGAEESWGRKAAAFLSDVAQHDSKASGGYYSKYFRQYYSGMHASLRELRRVTRPGGAVVLVVQDNYYKELHNDTPGILREMAKRNGFATTARFNFPVARTMASLNPRARTSRDQASAVESVLVLR